MHLCFLFISYMYWDGICKSFMEPWNWFQPGGPVQQPYLLYRPARLHSLAESIPRNRFLGSINVYKYGLGIPPPPCLTPSVSFHSASHLISTIPLFNPLPFHSNPPLHSILLLTSSLQSRPLTLSHSTPIPPSIPFCFSPHLYNPAL